GSARMAVLGIAREPAFQSWSNTGDGGSHDVLTKVFAELATAVGQTGREEPGFGVEHQSGRLEGRGRQHHNFGVRFGGLMRDRIDKTYGAGLPIFVEQNLTRDRIRSQGKSSGFHSQGQKDGGRSKHRAAIADIAAMAAEVTFWAAQVLPSGDGDAIGDE